MCLITNSEHPGEFNQIVSRHSYEKKWLKAIPCDLAGFEACAWGSQGQSVRRLETLGIQDTPVEGVAHLFGTLETTTRPCLRILFQCPLSVKGPSQGSHLLLEQPNEIQLTMLRRSYIMNPEEPSEGTVRRRIFG